MMQQKRYRVSVLLIIGLCLFAPFAFGQQQITLQEAVKIALDQNVNLQKATNSLALQQVEIDRNLDGFLPNLNVSSSANLRYGLGFDLTTAQLTNQLSNSLGVTVSGGVPLLQNGHWNRFSPSGNERAPAVQQAKLNLASSEYTLERTRQSVIFSVITNFLDFINNTEQLKIREENVAAQKQQLSQIEQFVQAGARAVADLYQQQATVAQAELQVVQTERLVELSKTRLVQILELDPFGNYQFLVPDIDQLGLTEQSYNLGELMRAALADRSDIQAQKTTIEASELGILIARTGKEPSLSVSASAGTNYSSLGQSKIYNQLADNRTSGVGLSFSIPIFDRNATKRNVQRAQVQHENNILELANIEQSIAVEVRQAYLDYLSAQKQLEASEVQLRYTERALQSEQERYNLQASTLVELTQARARYVDAVSQQAQARYSLIFQKQVIDYYLGKENLEDNLLR